MLSKKKKKNCDQWPCLENIPCWLCVWNNMECRMARRGDGGIWVGFIVPLIKFNFEVYIIKLIWVLYTGLGLSWTDVVVYHSVNEKCGRNYCKPFDYQPNQWPSAWQDPALCPLLPQCYLYAPSITSRKHKTSHNGLEFNSYFLRVLNLFIYHAGAWFN